MQIIKENWLAMGSPILITGCTTCYQEFKAILPSEKLISLWQILDLYGLPVQATGNQQIIAVHDPCTARNEVEIYQSIRLILDKLGFKVEELPYSKEKTLCCGYGGLAVFGNPQLTREVRGKLLASSDQDFLTYCWVCHDYLTLAVRESNSQQKIYHILDFLFGKGEESPYYDISAKRWHRRWLKKQLLRDIWNEDQSMLPVKEEMVLGKKLFLDHQTREILSQRMILIEEAALVIEKAEKTGKKLVKPADGHFIAYYRPHIITYWVE
ncbi:MAG: (Fe-S)-binding protein, partial [Clostridiales bacterium]